MNRPTVKEIERIVLESVEDVTGIERSQIRRTDRLVHDLKMDGDGFSFVFVPDVEKALGVTTTQDQWDCASTIQDAIDVFAAAVQRKP